MSGTIAGGGTITNPGTYTPGVFTPWANPTTPNLPDFTLFVYQGMMIDIVGLPITSPWIGYAFNRALALVISVPWGAFGGAGVSGATDYVLAVYNCGGAILVNTAPDVPGNLSTGLPAQTYFADLRASFGLNKPSYGVVQSTSDAGTSTTLAVPDGLANLTIGDLQFIKTPWGREYLSYAADFGGVFGLT